MSNDEVNNIETLGNAGDFTPDDAVNEEVSTNAVPDAPTVGEADKSVASMGADGLGSTTPTYAPNYKLNVMGKEVEVPEQFRSLMKDATSEKEIREVFEKAYGLDYAKPKHEATKTELESIRAEYEPIKKDLEVLSKFLENQDIGGFLQSFGLTDEQIIKYSMERLEYHQLPPEKQQQINQQRAQSMQYYRTQQELDGMKAQKAQTELQATVQELQSSAASPHIQPIAQSFNARAGQPDAFEKAVIAHAQNHFAMTRQDLSVGQAVESFIKTFGLAAGQPNSEISTPAGVNMAQRPQTLPKTGSGAAAPIKAKVRSIADIRNLSQQNL